MPSKSDLKEMFLAVLAVVMVLVTMGILVWFVFAAFLLHYGGHLL
jgi:preprotein translocase subunit SecE